MKDPLQVLNYDSWWRKELNNILPYVIPAVNDDITWKMEVQLEVDEQKVEHSFPFSWNLQLYKAPLKKACTNFEFSPEQLTITENVHMDNAQKRTFNLDPCVILNQSARLETSHFCIIKCA